PLITFCLYRTLTSLQVKKNISSRYCQSSCRLSMVQPFDGRIMSGAACSRKGEWTTTRSYSFLTLSRLPKPNQARLDHRSRCLDARASLLANRTVRSRTMNATRPSRPVSAKTRGYMASRNGPPVTPVPHSGNFFHNSNDCCHERSRSDVEVSILKVPRRICPSSCSWVNVYEIRSFTACAAHRGVERIPRSTMVIRIGFRGA